MGTTFQPWYSAMSNRLIEDLSNGGGSTCSSAFQHPAEMPSGPLDFKMSRSRSISCTWFTLQRRSGHSSDMWRPLRADSSGELHGALKKELSMSAFSELVWASHQSTLEHCRLQLPKLNATDKIEKIVPCQNYLLIHYKHAHGQGQGQGQLRAWAIYNLQLDSCEYNYFLSITLRSTYPTASPRLVSYHRGN